MEKGKKILKKNRQKLYVRTIQHVYNNQIEMFEILRDTIDRIDFWLNDLEQYIDFKINESNYEDFGMTKEQFELLKLNRMLKKK